MKFITNVVKVIIILLMCSVIIPFVFIYAIFIGFIGGQQNLPANHSIEYYANDLDVDIPLDGKLIQIYSNYDDGKLFMYLVYDMSEEVSKVSYIKSGFEITDDYDQELSNILNKISRHNQIEDKHKISVSTKFYVLKKNPKEGFNYYLVYDNRLDLFFIIYNWN